MKIDSQMKANIETAVKPGIDPQIKSAQRQHDEMDKKLWHVAKLYEKQFLNEMVKAMRGTVTYGNITKPNMGEQIYREQLDHEYVENWSETGGTGLSKLIFKELKEKIIPQAGGHKFTQPIKGEIEPPSSPVHGDIKDVKKVPSQMEGQSSFLFEFGEADKNILQSPWEGKLKSIQNLSENNKVLTIDHPWGFRSRLVFNGTVENLMENQSLGPGEVLASLDKTSNKVLWNIQKG